MKIVVGSVALENYRMNRNQPKDIDYWVSGDSIPPFGDVTVMPEKILNLVPTFNGYATPDAVFTIKCSHLPWDIKWEKTKNDILWLKSHGCEVLTELHTELRKHWESVHGGKDFLSLNKPKEDFFNDHVTYLYDHDYLHEVVASPREPVYKSCLKDGEDVLIDRAKFDLLSFEDKVRMFREEVNVIALERWVLNPHWNGQVSWYEAYGLALKKTIISLTKNWANVFIVENLDKFVKPDYSYFREALKLEERLMSKVDMKVFEDLAEELKYESLEELVWDMAEGGF